MLDPVTNLEGAIFLARSSIHRTFNLKKKLCDFHDKVRLFIAIDRSRGESALSLPSSDKENKKKNIRLNFLFGLFVLS